MNTTVIIVIIVALMLMLAIGGYIATRPKTEAEVDGELQKDVTEAETKLEEKTADLQKANEELAKAPTDTKAAEVAKKAEEVKKADAKVEEAKTKQEVVTALKVDCKVGNWGEYSQCELVDGVWKKKKSRSILTPASGGGAACPSDLQMSEDCEKINCTIGEWGPYTKCQTNGVGGFYRERKQTVASEAKYGGSCNPQAQGGICGNQILGVGADGNLYIKSLDVPEEDWIKIPDSGLKSTLAVTNILGSVGASVSLIDISFTRDGRILGSGTDGEVYLKDFIADNTAAPWRKMGDGANGTVRAIAGLLNNTLLGIGMDFQLYQKQSLDNNVRSPWTQLPNGSAPSSISQLADGTIVCTGVKDTANTNIKTLRQNNSFTVFSKPTLTAVWTGRKLAGVIKMEQLLNGKIVALTNDNKLGLADNLDVATVTTLCNAPNIESIAVVPLGVMNANIQAISNSVKGRYVSVGYVNRSAPNWLHVGSLQVFDKYNNLISMGKDVKQSSSHSSGNFPATKAVDGDWVNSFNHTDQGKNEFVEVDLGKEYEISRIVVYNRWDCCRDRIVEAKIIVSNAPNRETPVYTSEPFTDALVQWVYPPSTKVIKDNDPGYGDKPRGFYNITGDSSKPLVRCRYTGDGANIKLRCATEDNMNLETYNGKSFSDILGNLINFPSNFIRMFRQDVPMSNF